ncbi:hypothetical protein BX666DRAFT_1888299 [Dichotomocladium elegans]|nr:hypothetical protein BX666DRAFT_1888299 [Dichotomocladium elegans]
MYYQSHDDLGYGCLVRTEDDQLHPVRGFMMGISARVADEDKPINLIQHTPKRDKGPQISPEPKPVRPGGDLNNLTVTDQSVVTFERIQFKAATANNGKRRAAQQYYVLLVELMAKLDSGHLIKIASNRSAPLVVRGRSPGHYAERRGGRDEVEALPSPSQDHVPSMSASSSASSHPPQLPPPSSAAGTHPTAVPSLPPNDYYYNHAPSATQQRASSYQNGHHHPHVPMLATPPAIHSPLESPVVMRGPHDRSVSAPGSVDVYSHEMNRYGNGGGYYQHHHNPRDSSPWGSVHARIASSGETYHMPANHWYYQYNDSRHHHASSTAASTAANDHHGMAGSPGVIHPYQQNVPSPSTANPPYRTLPSSSFPSMDYHSDSASTSYVRDELKADDGAIKSNHRPQESVKHRELMEQHGRE